MVSISRVLAVVAALVALVALFVLTVPSAHATRFGVSVPTDAQPADDSTYELSTEPLGGSTTATTVGDVRFDGTAGGSHARGADGAGNVWPVAQTASEGGPSDPVPLPASVWLLGGSLLVTVGARFVQRRR